MKVKNKESNRHSGLDPESKSLIAGQARNDVELVN